MPVHWYYDAKKIKEDYNGWIKQYEKPHDAHPLGFLLNFPEPGRDTAINILFLLLFVW